MARRMILLSLGCGLLILTAGCCGPWGGPYGPYRTFRGGGWEPGCGPVRGAIRGPVYDDCGPGCGPSVADCEPACGPDSGPACGSCEPCGPSYYWGRNYGFRPLRWLGALFTCPAWCGPSCGPAYWGEWHSDPPDCWDPCDGCGNWTGPSTPYYGSTGPANGVPPGAELTPTPAPQPAERPAAKPTPAPPQPNKTTRSGYNRYSNRPMNYQYSNRQASYQNLQRQPYEQY